MSIQRPYLMVLLVGLLLSLENMAQPASPVFSLPGFTGPRAVLLDNPWNLEFLQDSMHTYRYQESAEEWVLLKRRISKYNHQGQPVESVDYKLDGSSWIPAQKVKYLYNADRQLVEEKTEIFPISLKKWIEDSCTTYHYNANGLLATIKMNRCRYSIPLAQINYTYSEKDEMLKAESLVWNTEHQIWRNSQRTIYTYNKTSRPLSELKQTWKEAGQKWENDQLVTYIYNQTEQHLIQFVEKNWNVDETSWEEEETVELEYNQIGQVINYNRYPATADSGQQHLETATSINYTYTSQGNPVQVLVGEYNSGQNSWNYTENNEYFWSRHATGTIQDNSNALCYFANPYHSGDMLRCPNLKTGVDYILRIVDLEGRTLHLQKIQNNTAFKIESSPSPGLYMVVVSGGLDNFARKVFFANK